MTWNAHQGSGDRLAAIFAGMCCTCSGLLLADIVAKVPNCPALIFLLKKKRTYDRPSM
jgi:MFS superfamily sulfate permease-like transporter